MADAVTISFGEWVESLSARDLANLELVKMADEGLDFVCITIDESPKSKLGELARKHPGRVIEVGIAEGDAVGIAAGLALSGKITYVSGFSTFLSLRATDQIHMDAAYNDLPVRLIGTHSGLTSTGGPTHFAICDIAIMRAIPNMTMVVPADAMQATRLIREAMTHPGPMYIRLPRGEEPLVYENQDYEYRIGKAVTARQGDDVAVIACGSCVGAAVAASNRLAEEGISVRVVDMHTVKPLDREAVVSAATTGAIITAEDHSVVGGLGDAVASELAEAGVFIKFKKLGIPDHFASVGYPEPLWAHYGYDADGIAREIRTMLGKS
jgi:transketolase